MRRMWLHGSVTCPAVYIQASEKPVTVTYHDLRVYP